MRHERLLLRFGIGFAPRREGEQRPEQLGLERLAHTALEDLDDVAVRRVRVASREPVGKLRHRMGRRAVKARGEVRPASGGRFEGRIANEANERLTLRVTCERFDDFRRSRPGRRVEIAARFVRRRVHGRSSRNCGRVAHPGPSCSIRSRPRLPSSRTRSRQSSPCSGGAEPGAIQRLVEGIQDFARLLVGVVGGDQAIFASTRTTRGR